ncbi:hypothetical protein OH77DRAFT_352634 [Trametes cingulata]|nr:hypothetical protein OH77DRAFT_352634 [Trametes cingulata]
MLLLRRQKVSKSSRSTRILRKDASMPLVISSSLPDVTGATSRRTSDPTDTPAECGHRSAGPRTRIETRILAAQSCNTRLRPPLVSKVREAFCWQMLRTDVRPRDGHSFVYLHPISKDGKHDRSLDAPSPARSDVLRGRFRPHNVCLSMHRRKCA